MTYVRAFIGHVYVMQLMLEHVASKFSPEKKGELAGQQGMDYAAAIAVFLFYSAPPFVLLQHHLESPHVALASTYQLILPGEPQ